MHHRSPCMAVAPALRPSASPDTFPGMEIPPVPPSDTFRFRARRRTRWVDEDNQQVVNNAVFMTLLEEARHEYFGGLGLLEENQFPFVLMQTNIRFLSPGRGGAKLEIELATTSLGSSSFQQVSRIREVESGTVLVEAQALLVAWCNRTRRKAQLAPAFCEAVSAFEGLDWKG